MPIQYRPFPRWPSLPVGQGGQSGSAGKTHRLDTPSTSSLPLRLAYLVHTYPAVSLTFILREVVALRKRGLAVEVASINEPPPRLQQTEQERSESDTTFYVKRQGALGALAAAGWILWRCPAGLFRGLYTVAALGRADPLKTLLCFFYFVEAALLARWMGRRQLTHLHVHFATETATVALILTYLVPITLSITVHGPDEFYDVSGYFVARKVDRASFVTCISFFAESQLMVLTGGRRRDKLELSRLGVDCQHFRARPELNASEHTELLCVARLVSTKGQYVLIEAVHDLLRNGRLVTLRLIGDGPDRKELERLVTAKGLSHQVFFEGSVNQDQIQRFYAAADLFVLPSFAEGIPVVLMEAMAMEIPCVATSINGIPELIRDGVDGLLVPPADVQGLATAIKRLMDEPELRRALGKAGRVRIQDAYELSKSADHLAEVFRRRLETIH